MDEHHPCCNIVQATYPGRVPAELVGVCNCDACWEAEAGVCDAISALVDGNGRVPSDVLDHPTVRAAEARLRRPR